MTLQKSQHKSATLYRIVTPEETCPYGLKSKDLLLRYGYQIDDRHLTTKEQINSFMKKEGVKTTPQTFIDGQRIGGLDDLEVYFDEKK